MHTVGDVLKHISSQKYQLSPVLLTLNNYLQHLSHPDEPWTSSALECFFNDCLIYPHWMQNRGMLTEDVRNAGLGFEDTRWPDQTQVIDVENKADFADAVNAYLTFQYQKTGSKFRMIADSDKIIYAILLHNDQTLSVRQFDRKFVIRQGQLEPLRTDLEVHYNRDLELEQNLPQKIEVAPFVTCRFTPRKDVADATLVRGYIFQKFHEFRDQSIESYPRLFYTLKRIEQFFVRRESDPFYMRLTQELERGLHQLRIGEPVEPTAITELQVRAQNALEYVFQSDKLLPLLLRELESRMTNRAPAPTKRPLVQGQLSHLSFQEGPREAAWAIKKKTTESDLTS